MLLFSSVYWVGTCPFFPYVDILAWYPSLFPWRQIRKSIHPFLPVHIVKGVKDTFLAPILSCSVFLHLLPYSISESLKPLIEPFQCKKEEMKSVQNDDL